MEPSVLTTSVWAEEWQRSWDLLEERYVPDRELGINALLDVVDAVVGPTPTVLDLACGTGTVTLRLLRRFPMARSIALDVDPVLLAIASATFATDSRVSVVRADLRDPAWMSAIAGSRLDAVLTATALHWLPELAVRRLYRDLAGLLHPGGVFAHLEYMPLSEMPQLNRGLARVRREQAGLALSRADWDSWWASAAADEALASAAEERRAVFETNYPMEEFSPPAAWHVEALSDAGFGEAGVAWRMGTGAVVAAVRYVCESGR